MFEIREYGNGLLISNGVVSIEIPPLEIAAFWDAVDTLNFERHGRTELQEARMEQERLEAEVMRLEDEVGDLETENARLRDDIATLKEKAGVTAVP